MLHLTTSQVIPWREIDPLPDLNGGLPSLLATVDTLRGAWEEALRYKFAQRRG